MQYEIEMQSPDAPAIVNVLGAVVDELGDQDTDCDRQLKQNVKPATQMGWCHLTIEEGASLHINGNFSK